MSFIIEGLVSLGNVVIVFLVSCHVNDLIRNDGRYTHIADELFRAHYGDTHYDLAFMVYAGDNLNNGDDAAERLLIFANIVP